MLYKLPPPNPPLATQCPARTVHLMAFSPLNTLGYSLYSNLPSPPAPRTSSSSSSSLFSNFYTSSQGSTQHSEPPPQHSSSPEKEFCVFTSTPSFFSQLCPQEKRQPHVPDQSQIMPYNSTYSMTHHPAFSPPSKTDQRMFYATRYSLFAEFLAANADFFASKRSLATYNSYPAGIPSTAGTVTCSSHISSPFFEAGAPRLFSDPGNWISCS